MGNETSKTNELRSQEFFKKYLSGKVLDIGAGEDPVLPGAKIFDMDQGDANNILEYLKAETFDCVYSSHCLEHMNDPIKTLDNWWKLVKPGGYLIVIVPHEDLYEQFIWPSIFSDNHNSSFRLNDKNLWSPVSINIVEACKKLYNYEVIKFEKHDKNYDYDLLFPKNIKPKKEIPFLVKKLKRIGKKFKNKQIKKKIFKFIIKLGYPIDQTLYSDALVQIQIIVKKN